MKIKLEPIDLAKHLQLHEISLVCKISKLIFVVAFLEISLKLMKFLIFHLLTTSGQPYDVATFQQLNEVFNKLKGTLRFLTFGYFKSLPQLYKYTYFSKILQQHQLTGTSLDNIFARE